MGIKHSKRYLLSVKTGHVWTATGNAKIKECASAMNLCVMAMKTAVMTLMNLWKYVKNLIAQKGNARIKFPIYPIILPGVVTRVSFDQCSVLSTTLRDSHQ